MVVESKSGAVLQHEFEMPENKGGRLPLIGSAEFDPCHSWGGPQQLPAPVHEKEQKSADAKKPHGAVDGKKTTGSFKVPAPPKTMKGALKRDSVNVTGIGGTSTAAAVRSRGRLSLQAGELMSSFGQKKTPSAAVKSVVPFYVDLVSLPVSTTGTVTINADFFRRIRARYYILNSSNPGPRVLELLLEAKATWETVEPVTVIPTGNPESLLQWYSTHEEHMVALRISVSPSASQCAVELQGFSCSAYRLEF